MVKFKLAEIFECPKVMYKLLWVHIYEQLKVIEKNESNRKLGLNISEAEFRTKFQTLRKLAQEARGIEISLGFTKRRLIQISYFFGKA